MGNINIKKILDYFKSGKFEIAKKETALLIKKFPNNYFLYNLFGAILAGQKKLDEAVIYFEKSIQIFPDYANAYNNLAGVLTDQKKYNKAIEYFQKAIQINPKLSEAHHNLGRALSEVERYDEAINNYNQAIKIKPNYVKAYYNLGDVYRTLNDFENAISFYEKAIQINPDYVDAHNNLGVAFEKSGEDQKAIGCYKKAIQINPDYVNAHNNLGMAFEKSGEDQKAIGCYEKAIHIEPNNLTSHWLSMNTFPIVYKNLNEIDLYRKRFEDGIKKINQLLDTKSQYTKKQMIDAMFSSTNFYLHYQGSNDLKLQTKYGKLIERLTQKIYPQFHKKRKKNKAPKYIKIGFISAFFIDHSVSKTHKNWIFKLDQKFIKKFVYYVGERFDHTTNTIKERVDNFYNHTDVDHLINQISKDNLDVLIYLDIGMNPKMQILGSLRLAPIQCNTWGHPITSGLKNIDYFFSSQLMEKRDSQKNYSEKLINLPGIGIDYNHADISNIKKTNVLNKFNKTFYFNLQSLFKLLPQDDHIYLDILKKNPNSCFWFIQGKNTLITSILKGRISKLFKKEGLSFEKYSYFHPRCQEDEFLGLIEQSDIILDSFNWSGCNSSLEAISLNKPIVTLPGAFMRGRHTYSFLKVLNIEETITKTKREYVKIAIKLANDNIFKNSVINKIKKNKNKLFNDEKPIRFLEKFLKKQLY